MKDKFYGWKIAYVCLGLFAVGATLTVTLGIFFPSMIDVHGFTQTQVSLIASIYLVGSLASAVIYKKVVSKIKLRVAIFIFLVIQAAAVVGIAFASSIEMIYALAFVAGFFGSNLPLFGQLLITNWFDKKRGAAMAVVVSGVGLNQIFIIPFLTNIIANFDYRIALVVYSVIMAFVAIIAVLIVKESPALVGKEKDGIIRFGGNVTVSKKKAGAINVPIKKVVKHKSFITLQMMHQLINVIGIAAGLQLATYLTTIGFTTLEIGSFYAVLGIISFFSRFFVGIFVDRIGLKKSNMIWGVSGILAILSLLFMPMIPELKYGYMILAGGGLAYTQIVTTIAYGRFYGDETFPQVQAISKVIAGISMVIGIVVSGKVIDVLGFNKLYTILAIGFAIAVCFGNIAMKSGTKLQADLKKAEKSNKAVA